MKNKISNKGLALSAVGGALSLVFIIASYYIKNISLTLNIVASIGVMIPLCKNFYKEAFLSIIAITILGAIFVNINILPYALVTGTYTYICLFFRYKRPLKKLSQTAVVIIKIIYASFVLFILFKVTNLIGLDLSNFKVKLDETVAYIFINSLFVMGFFFYEYFVVSGFNYLKKFIR